MFRPVRCRTLSPAARNLRASAEQEWRARSPFSERAYDGHDGVKVGRKATADMYAIVGDGCYSRHFLEHQLCRLEMRMRKSHFVLAHSCLYLANTNERHLIGCLFVFGYLFAVRAQQGNSVHPDSHPIPIDNSEGLFPSVRLNMY